MSMSHRWWGRCRKLDFCEAEEKKSEVRSQKSEVRRDRTRMTRIQRIGTDKKREFRIQKREE
jgi:hypothetical protein